MIFVSYRFKFSRIYVAFNVELSNQSGLYRGNVGVSKLSWESNERRLANCKEGSVVSAKYYLKCVNWWLDVRGSQLPQWGW